MKNATKSSLELLVNVLNNTTGSPATAGQKIEGKYVANPGHFMIEAAYGGVKLVQIGSPTGGERDVFRQGYVTKNQLQMLIYAFMDGIFYAENTLNKKP